jgi:RNA polymerase sigma-70 factor (ECF subfamily)
MVFSDDEILRRVQRGERSEYLKLFDRYYARVENYARRRLQNAEAARDIASETFLRAYRSVDGFRIGESISYFGYLLLICRRLIAAERVRAGTRMTRSLEENVHEFEKLADSASLPIDRLLESERRAKLQDALDRLPADDREIIHLAFERDLSRRDIGTILGKPSVSAVTSHLYRAMQKLKAIVIEQGYFTERETSRK